MYQDEQLTCEECGAQFTFTAGEQEFYAQKGLVNTPKRCPECRKQRRQAKRRKRTLHDAICCECGVATQVPFRPTEGKQVYCRECYAKKQEQVEIIEQ